MKATVTEYSLPITLKAEAKKSTVHKPQTQEKQSNQLSLPLQGDHTIRQDPLNITIGQTRGT